MGQVIDIENVVNTSIDSINYIEEKGYTSALLKDPASIDSNNSNVVVYEQVPDFDTKGDFCCRCICLIR